MDIFSVLSKNIVLLRKERRLTQEQLAHHANVTSATVSKIERKISNPTILTLDTIATALGVELYDLLRP